MKKILLKSVSLLLGVSLALTAAACGKGTVTDINLNIDLNSKINLNVLMPNSGYTIDEVNADSNAAVVESVTGYKVTYSQLPAANASSQLNTILIDRSPYNAIKLTNAQFADLIAQEALLDLTPAIEKFGSVLKDVISEESWDVVTVDGKIYGIPERASSDNIEKPMVFRQDILDELNLRMPTTKDELYTVLTTIKQRKNITPLTFDMYTPLVYSISSAFGIYTEWQEYTVDGTKKVLYYMDAPSYSDYVEYMAKLYSEGLIDVEVATQDSANAIQKFTSGRAAAIATSIWSVSAIVSGLEANRIITSTQAAGTQENVLCYMRSLKNSDGEYKVYRASGYTYITAVPFYMAENAGYVIDWINSKLKDDDTAHNFRDIVIGQENVHWTFNATEGYLPITGAFNEKDTASFFLTGSNEKVYTTYWLARVRKQAELYRAWSTLMEDADEVGVYDITDFIPPIEAYSSARSIIELYAQDQFFIMMVQDNGTKNLSTYLNKFNSDGGTAATNALNAWYYSR